MATFTKNLPGGRYAGQYYLELTVYESSYNKANNTSDMYWSLRIVKRDGDGFRSGYNHPFVVKVNGVTVANSSINGYDFRNYSSLTLASGTLRGVAHNADGGGGCYSEAWFTADQSGTIGSGYLDGWATMTKFNRVAVVTSVPATVMTGDPTSITWYDQNTGAYHDITLLYNHFDLAFWKSTNYRSGGTSPISAPSHGWIMELIKNASSNDIYVKYLLQTFATSNSRDYIGESFKMSTWYFKKPVISAGGTTTVGNNHNISVSGSYGALTGSSKYITKCFFAGNEVYQISHQGITVAIPTGNANIQKALYEAAGTGTSTQMKVETTLSNGKNADLGKSNTLTITVNIPILSVSIALVSSNVDKVVYSMSVTGNKYGINLRQVSLDGGAYANCVASGSNYIITVPVDGKSHTLRAKVKQENSAREALSNTLSFNTARHGTVGMPSKLDYLIGEASKFPVVANEATVVVTAKNPMGRIVKTQTFKPGTSEDFTLTPRKEDLDLGDLAPTKFKKVIMPPYTAKRETGWEPMPVFQPFNTIYIENTYSDKDRLGYMGLEWADEPPKDPRILVSVLGALGPDREKFIINDGVKNISEMTKDDIVLEYAPGLYYYVKEVQIKGYCPDSIMIYQSPGTSKSRINLGYYEDSKKSVPAYSKTVVPKEMLDPLYRPNVALNTDKPKFYKIKPDNSMEPSANLNHNVIALDPLMLPIGPTSPSYYTIAFRGYSDTDINLNEVTIETPYGKVNAIRDSNLTFHAVIRIKDYRDAVKIYAGPKGMTRGYDYELDDIFITKGNRPLNSIVYSPNSNVFEKQTPETYSVRLVPVGRYGYYKLNTILNYSERVSNLPKGKYLTIGTVKFIPDTDNVAELHLKSPTNGTIAILNKNDAYQINDVTTNTGSWNTLDYKFDLKQNSDYPITIIMSEFEYISYPEVTTAYPFTVHRHSSFNSSNVEQGNVGTVNYRFGESTSYWDGTKWVFVRPQVYLGSEDLIPFKVTKLIEQSTICFEAINNYSLDALEFDRKFPDPVDSLNIKQFMDTISKRIPVSAATSPFLIDSGSYTIDLRNGTSNFKRLSFNAISALEIYKFGKNLRLQEYSILNNFDLSNSNWEVPISGPGYFVLFLRVRGSSITTPMFFDFPLTPDHHPRVYSISHTDIDPNYKPRALRHLTSDDDFTVYEVFPIGTSREFPTGDVNYLEFTSKFPTNHTLGTSIHVEFTLINPHARFWDAETPFGDLFSIINKDMEIDTSVFTHITPVVNGSDTPYPGSPDDVGLSPVEFSYGYTYPSPGGVVDVPLGTSSLFDGKPRSISKDIPLMSHAQTFYLRVSKIRHTPNTGTTSGRYDRYASTYINQLLIASTPVKFTTGAWSKVETFTYTDKNTWERMGF